MNKYSVSSMKNADNSMLVTVSSPATWEDDFISIRTFDTGIGSKGRFLINAEAMSRWYMHDPERPFFDEDCGNLLTVRRENEGFHFKLWWTRDGYYDGGFFFRDGLTARIREFSLTWQELHNLFYPGNTVRKAVRIRNEYPAPQRKVTFTSRAMHSIAGLNKVERKALRKFFRDAFRWYGESPITVCDDGSKSFFFRETGGICGGIILTERRVKGHPAFSYEMHT